MSDDNYQINMFYQTTNAGSTWLLQIQLINADLGRQCFYD